MLFVCSDREDPHRGFWAGLRNPMVVPRDPDSSNLLRLLDWRAAPELRMPHAGKKLPLEERAQIRRWIHRRRQGQ